MIHAATTVPLGGELVLSVGYTMCFSQPTLSVTVARRRADQAGVEVIAEFGVARDRVDAVLEAIGRARDAMPR